METKKIYVGTTEITKKYIGTSVVYEGDEIPYKTLSYLETTGTQYIDTGIVPNENQVIKISFYVEDFTKNQVFFGSRTSGLYNTSTDQMYFNMGTSTYSLIVILGVTMTTVPYNNNHRINYTIDIPALLATNNITSVQTSFSGSFSGATQPHYLFALNNKGVPSAFGGRIYSFSIEENGVFILDLVPVLDLNDVPCMYDRVSGELFHNAGTGQFNYA